MSSFFTLYDQVNKPDPLYGLLSSANPGHAHGVLCEIQVRTTSTEAAPPAYAQQHNGPPKLKSAGFRTAPPWKWDEDNPACWNTNVYGVTGDTLGPDDPVPNPPSQTALTSAQQALAAATALLANRTAVRATARQALAAAQTVLDTAQNTYDAACMSLWKAQIAVTTMRRRQDAAGLSAALTRRAAAFNARTAAGTALTTASTNQSDAETASTQAEGQCSEAAIGVATARATYDSQRFVSTLNQANYENTLHGGSGHRYTLSPVVGGNKLLGSTSQLVYQFNEDAEGRYTATLYDTATLSGAYRLQILLPSALVAGNPEGQLLVEWNEYTVATPAHTVVVPPNPENPDLSPGYSYNEPDTSVEPTFAAAAKSELLHVADAVETYAGSGYHVLYTSVHTGKAADSEQGEKHTRMVAGERERPTLSMALRGRRSVRVRQGWPEFVSQPGATTRRYLTLTASRADTAPPDADYSGTKAYAAPPDDQPGELVLEDNLSEVPKATMSEFDDPRNGVAVTDSAQVLSPTRRVLAQPPGLVFDLSQEQTPKDLQDQVADDVAPTLSEASPGNGGNLAIRCFAADGEYARLARFEYRMSHTAHDTRELPATARTFVSRWQVRKRDLLTGAVTREDHEREITLTGIEQTKTDTGWTAVEAKANESVEIVPLLGVNPTGQSFDLVRVTAINPRDPAADYDDPSED